MAILTYTHSEISWRGRRSTILHELAVLPEFCLKEQTVQGDLHSSPGLRSAAHEAQTTANFYNIMTRVKDSSV